MYPRLLQLEGDKPIIVSSHGFRQTSNIHVCLSFVRVNPPLLGSVNKRFTAPLVGKLQNCRLRRTKHLVIMIDKTHV